MSDKQSTSQKPSAKPPHSHNDRGPHAGCCGWNPDHEDLIRVDLEKESFFSAPGANHFYIDWSQYVQVTPTQSRATQDAPSMSGTGADNEPQPSKDGQTSRQSAVKTELPLQSDTQSNVSKQ
jgi:hypothetical protein